MTVLEILQKRKELYENDLRKTCFTESVRHDTESRIKELENLIFIINTQNIKGIK
jgi:hypothetical protein